MLSCTPVNTGKMFKAMENGDFDTAAQCLNHIIDLRDCFVRNEVLPAFTVAMNLLGCEGNFSYDYARKITQSMIDNVRTEMIRIGEITA